MEPSELFAECWRADGPRVMAYARRHIGEDHAQDVVADTFMIAWRNWDKVPDPPIGWLIATARGVIRNRLRSQRRHRALSDRVALLDQAASVDSSESAVSRQDALARLAALSDQHREALLLTSWDGLNSEEAARVLGIQPAAFRRRVSRARECLESSSAQVDVRPESIQEIS